VVVVVVVVVRRVRQVLAHLRLREERKDSRIRVETVSVQFACTVATSIDMQHEYAMMCAV